MSEVAKVKSNNEINYAMDGLSLAWRFLNQVSASREVNVFVFSSWINMQQNSELSEIDINSILGMLVLLLFLTFLTRAVKFENNHE